VTTSALIQEVKALTATLRGEPCSTEMRAACDQLSFLAIRLNDNRTAERQLLEELISCLFEAGLLAQVPSTPDDPPPPGLLNRVDHLIEVARRLAVGVAEHEHISELRP
jgi:hypothetical protein